MRTLARVVTALVVLECAACLYVLAVGEIHLDLGPLRISAGSWRHPFTQAIVLALVATALYWRDAAQGEWDVVPRLARRFGARAMAPIRAEPLLWSGVFAGVAAAVIVCDRLAEQAFVIGSEAGGWAYPYVRGVPAELVAIAASVCAIGSAIVWWQESRPGGEWGRVAVWVLVATGLQLLLRSLTPFSFEQIFLSAGANSFYTVTQQHDAASVLGQFAELRASWPLHAHSNMPGKLMLLYALELISNDPVTLSWLMVIVSNLGGLLLYVFVRDLFGDRRVALYALVLYLFVPAKLFFFPLMNTVTPVVAFGCLLLFQRWLQRASLGYAVAAGVGLYVLVFFEPMPLVIGGLVALIAIRTVRQGRSSWRLLVQHSIVVVILSFAATLGLLLAVSGFNTVDAIGRVAADAAKFNATEARPYGLWAWRNLVEFAFGAGICQAVLFWVAAADGLRRSGIGTPAELPIVSRPIVVVCGALLVMLLALDLAGVNRGEAIRLWIFLACLFQIPAAYVCARLNNRAAIVMVLGVTVLQAALGTAMIGFVVP